MTQWASIFSKVLMYACVLHTVGGSITHWCKHSWACVCAAHSGRVYHTVGGYIFDSRYVCVLHTMGGFITQWVCIFSKIHGHACVLHTVDGSITQWAGIFSTAAMCVYCTQWAGLSHSGLAYFQKNRGHVCAAHIGRDQLQKYLCMCVLHTVDGSIFKTWCMFGDVNVGYSIVSCLGVWRTLFHREHGCAQELMWCRREAQWAIRMHVQRVCAND